MGFFDEYAMYFVMACYDRFMKVYETIAELSSNLCIGIYGGGEHTKMLFWLTPIQEKNIVDIFDKRSHEVAGWNTTYPSDERLTRCDIIVISSKVYQSQMKEELKEKYNYKGKIICLYDDDDELAFYEFFPQYCEADSSRINRYNRICIDRTDVDFLLKIKNIREKIGQYRNYNDIYLTGNICKQYKFLIYILQESEVTIKWNRATGYLISIKNKGKNYQSNISREYICLEDLDSTYMKWCTEKARNIDAIKAAIEDFCYVIEESAQVTPTYRLFNKNHVDYVMSYKGANESYSDVAIVIQGPICYQNNYTFESIKQYKMLYPGIHIVLSTWEDEKKNYKFDEFGTIKDIQVLTQKKPKDPGGYNINLQITSTWFGIRYVKDNLPNVKYVCKLRTDERIYAEDAIQLLRVMAGGSHEMNISSKDSKIICSPTPSSNDIPYYFADHWNFGSVEDMLEFWDNSLIEYDGIENSPMNYPESALYYRFQQKKVNKNLRDGEVYTLIPIEMIQLEWNKYWYLPIFESRSRFYCREKKGIPDHMYSTYDFLKYNQWL